MREPQPAPAVAVREAPLLRARGLVREYPSGEGTVRALGGVDLDVDRGELVAIRGRSGSGKTTLLNVLGGLDRPTAGTVIVDGVDVHALPEEALVAFRRRTVAYVFQTFGLLPILTAAENVEVPLRLLKVDGAERDERVRELLALVGLAGRADHRPQELSGGEQQRVAIARALASRAPLLLADEPTGQLDSTTGHAVMELLHEVVHSQGITALVATHDRALLDAADRVVELRDGHLVDGRSAE